KHLANRHVTSVEHRLPRIQRCHLEFSFESSSRHRAPFVKSMSVMPVVIRDETPADYSAIEGVIADAFRRAVHSSGTEQFIVNALRNARQLTVSLVAETRGFLIGHAAASPVRISDGTPNWYGLGPIAVAPESQARGV